MDDQCCIFSLQVIVHVTIMHFDPRGNGGKAFRARLCQKFPLHNELELCVRLSEDQCWTPEVLSWGSSQWGVVVPDEAPAEISKLKKTQSLDQEAELESYTLLCTSIRLVTQKLHKKKKLIRIKVTTANSTAREYGLMWTFKKQICHPKMY